jgi:hypothetical protein
LLTRGGFANGEAGRSQDEKMKTRLLKYLNRSVLAWGYLSMIAVVGYFGWGYLSYRSYSKRYELMPPWMDLKDLAKNPDFVTFTNDMLRTGIATDLPPDVIAACFCFKTKAARRRTEEWDKVHDLIRSRAKASEPLTEEQLRALLGEPDHVEGAKKKLRYDLINFGVGGSFVTIEVEDGKVLSANPGNWIQ